MRISRRDFLESSAMTAAAAATAGFPIIATAADGTTTTASYRSDVIARLSLDDAKSLVGSAFLVRATSRKPVRFDCVAVKAMPENATSTSPEQPFAMSFLARSPISLKQGTYRFAHSVLGKFDLFVVPSAPHMTPQYYTAIINHARS